MQTIAGQRCLGNCRSSEIHSAEQRWPAMLRQLPKLGNSRCGASLASDASAIAEIRHCCSQTRQSCGNLFSQPSWITIQRVVVTKGELSPLTQLKFVSDQDK